MTKSIMCVWYWFIFLLYVYPFSEISYWSIYRWKAERVQTKSGNGAIRYRRI